ncbi:MAG: hypothetical protein WC777_06310 [Candidatus Gracilibacteria bacterium]
MSSERIRLEYQKKTLELQRHADISRAGMPRPLQVSLHAAEDILAPIDSVRKDFALAYAPHRVFKEYAPKGAEAFLDVRSHIIHFSDALLRMHGDIPSRVIVCYRTRTSAWEYCWTQRWQHY